MSETDDETHICLDCAWHSKDPEMSRQHEGYCVHFTPEYWEVQGYRRNWGDAAVMAWPTLEILIRKEGDSIAFLVLCPSVRRPVMLSLDVSGGGGGEY